MVTNHLWGKSAQKKRSRKGYLFNLFFKNIFVDFFFDKCVHEKKVYIVYILDGLRKILFVGHNVSSWSQKNCYLLFVFKNGDDDDKNDNHSLVARTLSVVCSGNNRSRGLTKYELQYHGLLFIYSHLRM